MDGVVFDFDGVIAASMPMHAEAYRQALAPFGVTVADADVYAREGARSETILRDLAPDVEMDVAALADEKQRIFQSLGEVPLIPDAEETVTDLQTWAPTALVTGTRRSNLEAIIPDLLLGFRAVLSQESYSQDKPHPEPYLRAAQGLGIEPARLICVENAVRGIQSAKAAGYGHVVAVTTTMSREALSEADTVVTGMLQAGRVVRRLLRRD